MRALVVGATGRIGRRTAAELARSEEVEELCLAGRDEAAVMRLARLLGSRTGKTRGIVLDVTEPGALETAAKGYDVIVSCAGPPYLTEVPAVRAAIAAGTAYVSLCDEHVVAAQVASLDQVASDAGSVVLCGCALSPGITNMMVRLAAEGFDEVHEIEIALATSAADADGAASALHLLHQLSQDAPQVSDGRITTERAGTGPKPIFFPEPVGWVETFHSGHPEVATLMHQFPQVSSLVFRFGLTEKVAMDVMRASALLGAGRTEERSSAWLRLAQPLRPLIERLPPRGAPWTAARVDLRGVKADRYWSVALGVTDHIPNLASVPLALAATAIVGKSYPAGTRSVDEIFEPKPFFRALAQRGIRIARLEPVPL